MLTDEHHCANVYSVNKNTNMAESTPHSAPDLDYAKSLRIGVAYPQGDSRVEKRFPISAHKISETADGQIADGTRSQLDAIVLAVDTMAQHGHEIAGYTDDHVRALEAGYVVAGTNASGEKDKSEMRFHTAEEFRGMVARSVGGAALQAYESDMATLLAAPADEAVPRLISTVKNVEPFDGAAAADQSGSLKSTFKPRVEQDTPGKLKSTFNDQEPVTTDPAAEPVEDDPKLGTEVPDDGWVSFVESNPLEPREKVETSDTTGTEVDSTEAQVDEHEAEKSQVSMADIMKTPKSLMDALSDTELDPGMRSQLRQVVGAWNKLQTAKIAEEAWGEVVIPQLRKLDESLPGFADTAKSVAEQLGEFESGLTQFATAVEYGDLERMTSLNRRYRFVENFSEAARMTRQLTGDETIGRVSRNLDLQLLENDDRIKRVMRKDTAGFTEDDAEALFSVVGVAGAGSIEDVQAALTAADESGALRTLSRRKDAIESMIQFGRATDRVLSYSHIDGVVRTVENMLQELFAQRSRMTSSDVHMIRGKLKRDLMGPIEQLQKLSRLTQMYKEEIKR